MRSITKILLVSTVLVGLGCSEAPKDPASTAAAEASEAPQSATVSSAKTPKKAGLQTAPLCPQHLVGYCRGWDVYNVDTEIKPDPENPDDLGHLDIGDKVAVGTASGASDATLFLFARDRKPGADKGPADRWGANRIRLHEINTDSEHDCLAGNVRLPDHGSAERPHAWHKVTLRLEPVPDSPIGNEQRLAICFSALGIGGGENPSPPDSCEQHSCPETTKTTDGKVLLLHGGVAHAQD